MSKNVDNKIKKNMSKNVGQKIKKKYEKKCGPQNKKKSIQTYFLKLFFF